ncbi:MAG: hypothetical protein IJY85_03310 [Ruminococcus sp.]|nr:hypothetical protein [Ruminococcus sp.]
MSWQIQSSVNDGYPYNTENPVFAPAFSAPYPLGIMCVDGVTNDGYPYRLSVWAACADKEGISRLHYGKTTVTELYFRTQPVSACYIGGEIVFRRT